MTEPQERLTDAAKFAKWTIDDTDGMEVQNLFHGHVKACYAEIDRLGAERDALRAQVKGMREALIRANNHIAGGEWEQRITAQTLEAISRALAPLDGGKP